MYTTIGNKLRINKKYITWVCSIAMFFCAPSFVQAVGVSPGSFSVENVVNGVRIERTLTISKSSPIGRGLIEVHANGPGARYIELPTTEFFIPDGQRTSEYTFYVYPEAAPNGQYETFITFVHKSVGENMSGGSGAAAQAAVAARIKFSVSDKEVKQFEVLDVKVEDSEVGMPISARYIVNNTGNVDIRFSSIEFELIDVTDETHTYRQNYTENQLPFMSPGTDELYTLDMTERVPIGRYQVQINFYESGKLVHQAGGRGFEVEIHPPGTLGQSMELITFDIEKDTFGVNDLVLVQGSIENTGNIGASAVFFIDIFRDGERIDLIRSTQKFVPKGETTDFQESFRPEAVGSYELTGYFEYAGTQTKERKIPFTVVAAAEGNNGDAATAGQFLSPAYLTYLIIFGILLILLFFFIVFKRRRKKDDEVTPVVPPASPPPAPPVVQSPVVPPAPVTPVAPPVAPAASPPPPAMPVTSAPQPMAPPVSPPPASPVVQSPVVPPAPVTPVAPPVAPAASPPPPAMPVTPAPQPMAPPVSPPPAPPVVQNPVVPPAPVTPVAPPVAPAASPPPPAMPVTSAPQPMAPPVSPPPASPVVQSPVVPPAPVTPVAPPVAPAASPPPPAMPVTPAPQPMAPPVSPPPAPPVVKPPPVQYVDPIPDAPDTTQVPPTAPPQAPVQ